MGLRMDARKLQLEKLLREISKKIDINWLLQDPLIELPFFLKQSQPPPKNDYAVPTYTQFLLSLRKLPCESAVLEYLEQINILLSKPPSKFILTGREKNQVLARKLWSDVVSDMDQLNMLYQTIYNVREVIIKRLESLGYTTHTAKIYQDCIRFLETNSVIVVTFNASFLKKGLTHHQTMNLFERNSDARGKLYQRERNATEKELFSEVSASLAMDFRNSLSARPRYGALILLDQNHTIEPITNYGKSFAVLCSKIKLNSLFNPHDSMDAKFQLDQHLVPCTFHHLDFILWQSTDKLLTALAERATKGMLPLSHSQQYQSKVNLGGYIEVLLPAIDFLDSACVQHIHINEYEYKITQHEKDLVTSRGIRITSSTSNPYCKLSKEFLQCVEQNDIQRVHELIKAFPSLMLSTNHFGQEPLHMAAYFGYTELVKIFLAEGAELNTIAANGYAPLHLAVNSGDLELVQLLIAKGAYLNIQTYLPGTPADGMTPVFMASYLNTNADILIYLIKSGADVKIAATSGQVPLDVAILCGKTEQVRVLGDVLVEEILPRPSKKRTADFGSFFYCNKSNSRKVETDRPSSPALLP